MEFTILFLQLFWLGITLLSPLLIVLVLVFILLGQIVAWRESWGRFDALYWTFVTATTVGYGDIRPLEKLSRVLAILIAFVGLIFTGILVALALNAVTLTFKSLHGDIDADYFLEEVEQ